MSDGPKRHNTEPTLAIDRTKLPPSDKAAIALAADSYPELPAALAMDEPDDVAIANASPDELRALLRARRQNRPTMVPCPRCEHCSGCNGDRMITVERLAEIRAEDAT